MKTIQRIISADTAKRLAVWAALAATLIAIGFLLDGSTEVGHHLFLILGGAAIGAGAEREIKDRL